MGKTASLGPMKKALALLLLVACNQAQRTATEDAPAAPPRSAPAPETGSVAPPTSSDPSPPSSPPAPIPSARAGSRGAASPPGKAVFSSPAPSPSVQPASARITGHHFTLDVSSKGCTAGNECALTVRLEATGGYHINKDYPYKLTLNAAPNVVFLGRDPAGVLTFSKSAGDFQIIEEHVATMTARLKPSAKGTTSLTGIYKMSVCSESNCQLEQAKIFLDLLVL